MTLTDPTLVESSGLAVSATHPGVLWTHNDGGSVRQVLAVDRHGSTVATVTLAGIDPYDPEALAPGTDDQGRPALFLGDLGDNRRSRPDVSVFRFREPTRLADATVPARWYRFTYPDGPHDAEALLVDADGRIMVATKEISGAALYQAPREAGHRGERDQRPDPAGRRAGAGHRRRVPARRPVRAAHLHLGLRLRPARPRGRPRAAAAAAPGGVDRGRRRPAAHRERGRASRRCSRCRFLAARRRQPSTDSVVASPVADRLAVGLRAGRAAGRRPPPGRCGRSVSRC